MRWKNNIDRCWPAGTVTLYADRTPSVPVQLNTVRDTLVGGESGLPGPPITVVLAGSGPVPNAAGSSVTIQSSLAVKVVSPLLVVTTSVHWSDPKLVA